MKERLFFASDYLEGAHPNIINRMVETNLCHTVGYGEDEISESARERIRKACECPGADVHFLVGGTQTNATVIDAVLKLYQGVIAADSGHIAVHEAGAVEFTGHKVLPLKSELGKIKAEDVEKYLRDFYEDPSYTHMVNPGMVYISQPTEYGTLYSKAELEALSRVCQEYKMPLYVDGARLAYALASPENNVTLADLARLTDVFYIGGTKCGALLGEAVVVPNPELIPHFFTIIKQHGALLAKGRLLGIQFDELFKDDLYLTIGKSAVNYANEIKHALKQDGYRLYFDSPTNQVFFLLEKSKVDDLAKKVEFSNFERYDDEYIVARYCTSWATTREDVDVLLEIIHEFAS
ncbi:MAG: low specificity L-threonine aldolase [Lachnospiraceae bacterium]|nr:low specificity L-threonine aldolase [Lachnospiraceae bacterium]